MQTLPQWKSLSSIAQQMLHSSSERLKVGHTAEEVRSFWSAQSGSFSKTAFEEFLYLFAGLTIAARHWLPGGQVSFHRIKDRLNFRQGMNADLSQMFVGESPEIGIYLNENGRVNISHALGWMSPLSESFTCFLEATAIAWNADKQGKVLDSVSTSIPDGARSIADKYALRKVSVASDDYCSWWASDNMGIGIHPQFGRRYKVAAFWPREDGRLEKLFHNDLTQLLEPHYRAPREAQAYRRFRDTGDFTQFGLALNDQPCAKPSDSFREAARTGLQELAKAGSVLPVPGKNEFQKYLARTLENATRQDTETKYYCAVGLLSYGVIDAFDVLLENLPMSEGTAWGSPLWAAAFLHFILPFDLTFSAIENTDATKQWFNDHRHQLRWNEQKGRFEMLS